ncbi:peptidase M48 Ste24p [Leptothrix cholodnii SP-6]|uniref:Peptidase M48 Ste24p n=1 Tax=Leptothrix cholodnii (strain ATCC 51168 / LMG 8142 / SP-6) TaxID=395495 RepID=B1Y2E0_LEPCP|nr:M48 family metalloprotease [Leptothrix cholodnii]ACB35593.1 peptidase M48 Ste24p [Leptothrix cholodnii SP-6]
MDPLFKPARPALRAFAARLHDGRPNRRDIGLLFGSAAGLLGGCASPGGVPPTGDTAAPAARATPSASPAARPPPKPAPIDDAGARALDAQQAPQQFSLDLGALQDVAINTYVGEIGFAIQAQAPRRGLPYSYRALNAHHLNAYAFPAGGLGITRGLLIELQDEAELAALIGQQLGHVNARHALSRQRTDSVAQAVVTNTVAASQESAWTPPIGLAGQIGASALIPTYSAEQMREADAAGLQYLVGAGYPGLGMVTLQQRLAEAGQQRPALLAAMAAAQPTSPERRDAVRRNVETLHAGSRNSSTRRERFMDRTASLRHMRALIEACKNGELALARKDLTEAHAQFKSALEMASQDYAANLRMAQCLQAMGQVREARAFAIAARDAYPQEAQAHKLAATLALAQRDAAAAWQDLEAHDRLLSGDPGVVFLKGVTLELMGQSKRAAEHYRAYLGYTEQGQAAQYAATRLKLLGHDR